MGNLIDKFVKIDLIKPDNFLKIKETLQRIGVASKMEKKLTQSCHILHKQGEYYLVHFKELFALDGKPTDFTEEDIARRNSIAKLLEDWELLKILNPAVVQEPVAPISSIKIISYKEKGEWVLTSKYNIGRRR